VLRKTSEISYRTAILEQTKTITVKNKHHAFVTVTAYNAERGQTDSTPTITAFGTKVAPRTIAVSRDLYHKYGWTAGRQVYVYSDEIDPEYRGIYTVNDLMNKRYNKAIDIFLHDKQEALEFGRVKDVSVSLIINQNI
jgi:3D (Asp-Asp-Asp) domain-containing protein